jgi:WD40 repeat protein
MRTKPKQRKTHVAQLHPTIFIILSILIFLLITFTIVIILGNLNIIYWPTRLNTVFLSIIIPNLGVIIALAQWLHTLSPQEKKEENGTQPLSTTISSERSLSPILQGTLETQRLEGERDGKQSLTLALETEQMDMGEAPHVEHFYGRADELVTLQHWIVEEGCRLISIIGVGGIGKTSLVAKFIAQNPHVFRTVFWRSLLNAPPLERILQECLQFLTTTQQIAIPQGTEEQMRLLIAQIRKQHCLLVLDNAEAVLKSGSSTGAYKDGYENYGKLINLLGETSHQSCVLITSREQLREISLLEGPRSLVRSYRLGGMKIDDARTLLENKGLSGEEKPWNALIERFAGNPMMLAVISPTIRESYQGLISQYLAEFSDTPLNEHPDLRVLLDSQFERLSFLEQQIFYWLAIGREAFSLEDLRESVVQPMSKMSILTAIEALRRRSWIEQSGLARYTLQPAIMDAVTDRFNELIVQEILSGKSNLFASHTLGKAQAKSYVRNSQFQLILKVIAQKLFTNIGKKELEEKLRQRLATLRNLPEKPGDYEAGNILNLLVQTGFDLRGTNFSGLVVRQAYLQEVDLPEVNFAYANLTSSVFADTFGNILSVAASPQTEADLLAAGTSMGEIRLWQASSGLPLQTLRGHADWVWSIAFSADGKTLMSGSSDQTVRLWEVSSGKCLRVLHANATVVRAVAFGPNSSIVASGSYERVIHLWEISSGKCLATLHGHTNAVTALAFSPDGKFLVSGSHDQTIRIWEVSSSTCLAILEGHTNAVRSVTFSTDGTILASGSGDHTVRLWDISSNQCLATLSGHTGVVRSVAINLEGKTLVSGSDDRTVRLWDISSNQCLMTLYGHTSLVRSVAFNHDGETLISGSYDQTVRLWEANSGKCLMTLHGYANEVRSVSFSPNNRILASGSGDHAIRLWNVDSGQRLAILRGHTNFVRSIAFHPHVNMLASGSNDQTVRLWDVSREQNRVLSGHANAVRSVVFNPDGTILASGSGDRMINLWAVDSGQLIRILQGHENAVTAVAFNLDGTLLVSGANDQTVRLWEVSSGRCLAVLQGHANPVRAVAFSPDGTMIASGSEDRTVRLWEVNGGQCLEIIHGHANVVSSLAFRPDGEILASGSYDGTVRLWDMNNIPHFIALQGHNHWVWTLAFSPNSNNLASGSFDGVISLWSRQGNAYQHAHTLRNNQPYERMNILQAKGLTEAQKASLLSLGAVEVDTHTTFSL